MRPIVLRSRRLGRRLVPHSLRRRLRHPTWSWGIAVALGLATGGIVYGSLQAAAEGADRFGDLEPAVVARSDLPAGTVLAADDVEEVELPGAALPPDRPTEPPIGRALRAPVAEGQTMADAQLADGGESGLAAVVERGRAAVALPRGDHSLGLSAGDEIDLWGLDPNAGTVAAVAFDAAVVEVGELTLVASVDAEHLPDVMGALAAGTVWPTLPG